MLAPHVQSMYLSRRIGVGVKADGRQFQLRFECPAVERFDIDQLVRES